MFDSKTKRLMVGLGLAESEIRSFTKRTVISKNGTQTHTYYSSVPLKGATDPAKIGDKEDLYYYCGTNCIVQLKENKLYLLNSTGYICIEIGCCLVNNRKNNDTIQNEVFDVCPTFNGALIRLKGINTQGIKCLITSNIPYAKTRKNDKYIALMKAPFSPYAVLSVLFAKTNEGKCYPAIMDALETHPGGIKTFFSSPDRIADVYFEINMYESKVMQDTTVESFHPDQNNAFGSTAFIGSTPEFGEQWLYSKVNLSAIKENPESIKAVNLLIPVFEGDINSLEGIELSSRFCSFRSNWNNKLLFKKHKAANIKQENKTWISIALTEQIKNEMLIRKNESSGIILRQKGNFTFPVLLSTGDCFAFPQILEIVT